jgi:superfamily II DNA or RNA helicase
LKLRPYQSRASAFLAPRKLALCVCPAGGGKTLIAADALDRASIPGDVIGWACNTREQVEQGKKALASAGITPAWVKCVAGIKAEDVQSLDFLVIDEAHHVATAVTWQAVFSACKGTIFALTATPPDDLDVRMFWDGIFGDNVITIPRDEVQAGGHLAKGRVTMIDIEDVNQYRDEIDRTVVAHLFEYFSNWGNLKNILRPFLEAKEFFTQSAIDALSLAEKKYFQKFEIETNRAKWLATKKLVIGNEARNDAAATVCNIEVGRGKTGLLLVESIEQGKAFAEQIPGSVLAYSRMGKKARAACIEGARDGSIKCMIATSLADEGLDIPRLSFVVLTSCGKSSRLAEQRTGRVLRQFEGKAMGHIYDFTDNGTPMGRRNSVERRKSYKRLGYEIETTNHLIFQ